MTKNRCSAWGIANGEIRFKCNLCGEIVTVAKNSPQCSLEGLVGKGKEFGAKHEKCKTKREKGKDNVRRGLKVNGEEQTRRPKGAGELARSLQHLSNGSLKDQMARSFKNWAIRKGIPDADFRRVQG